MIIKPSVQHSGEISGETRRTETAHRSEPIPWHAWAAEFVGTFIMVAWGLSAVVFMWVYFLGPLGGATAIALLWKPKDTAGVRSVFCAKLFHTDRYQCHLADCHFAGRHPSVGGASRKEDLS
jgi:hypothetical protein